MAGMRVQRYNYRRRGTWIGLGCLFGGGCFVFAIVGILILLPALPAIGLRLMGFSSVGQTASTFNQATPFPTVELINPVVPDQVTVNLGEYGSHNLSPQTYDYTVEVGNTTDGGQAATASFSEASLTEICRQLSAICRNEDSRFQNVRLDLKPGGAIVYADMTLPDLPISQTAGVVLRLDSTATRFEVAGVDVQGTLYSVPTGSAGEFVGEVERIGNSILDQLTVQAGGGNFSLSQVSIDENSMTLLLR